MLGWCDLLKLAGCGAVDTILFSTLCLSQGALVMKRMVI